MTEDLERDESLTGSVHAPQRPLDDAGKLAKIAEIVRKQTAAQNEEDAADPYWADAYLAMEAIEIVLTDAERTNGAYRTYFPSERPR